MAKHTTLNNLFTAIADAIRYKKGTGDVIIADNFPDEIIGIEGGGSYPQFVYDDVATELNITPNAVYEEDTATLYITDTAVGSELYENAQSITYNGKKIFRLVVDDTLVWEKTFDPVLANNTWEQISEAAKMGIASLIWKVGDQISITINNVSYTVDIIGFDHDDVTDPASYGRTKAGITFQLHNLISSGAQAMHSSSDLTDGWQNTNMRNSTLTTYFSQLSEDLQNEIVYVDKISGTGTGLFDTAVTSDRLFLLSAGEVLGLTVYSTDNTGTPAYTEGDQYAYYTEGNLATKLYAASSTYRRWWTRSSSNDTIMSGISFSAIDTEGSLDTGTGYGNSLDISFAFCV